MEALFMACLVGGVLYTVVAVIFGDIIGQALDGALDFLSIDGHPLLNMSALAGAVTAFGGAGLLLDRYSALGVVMVVLLALLAAVIAGILVFFIYIRPMDKSENSIAFSTALLVGMLAEVLVPIPAAGCGEVLLKVGAGVTNQIASSYDGQPIEGGSRVVVVEVQDGTLLVSKVDMPLLDDEMERRT
ncbi:protease [Paenibacillus kobensis]|uniref:protease n=1 Tax=Paenibacillus kobensis TaxID=59841 RepID=UPI000FD7E022|nr:protease [Paenibacillus kobensis]